MEIIVDGVCNAGFHEIRKKGELALGRKSDICMSLIFFFSFTQFVHLHTFTLF